ncbi:uncharacterized protein N7511_002828 [Penicillium nucicola]|uniref:uncharacterized protein n=1 Tax=Penicillium nucicola TaxID=1850975 RepID=UPI002544EDE4|nr:uncharacterized protein N7511_002828 [Penicillium nucicola]KAJ5770777.1 hypothetical protein N7511_002828 [Penicillium nucicola]
MGDARWQSGQNRRVDKWWQENPTSQYDKLAIIYKWYKFKSYEIYNFDETGFFIG